MNFEFLPNEILIECFKHFDALEIFHSFDQLNIRFNKLIRSIPLKLNFPNINKSIYDGFCKILLSDSSVQEQIYSLQLSNSDTNGQTQKFLTLFSLDEFPNLQSLTLIEIGNYNLEQLKSVLPSLSKLSYFHLIDRNYEAKELMSILPLSKLRTLSAGKVYFDLTTLNQISSIENLTLSSCSWHILYKLLKYTPKLKYLNIQVITTDYPINTDEQYYLNTHFLQLKTLILKNFRNSFENLEQILKYITPTIKVLIITTQDRTDVIDASRWQHLITSSLLQLTIFKFKFTCYRHSEDNHILDQFQQFQSDFWYKQHQWYTEYSVSKYSAVIYTIPYLSNTYTFAPSINIISNNSMNYNRRFINVTDLVLFQTALIHNYQYYFPNIKSLTLENVLTYEKTTDDLLGEKHFDCLKRLVNLYSIQHLTITQSCKIENTTILLKLFEQAKQLSSLKIDVTILKFLYNDSESGLYLKQMIRKLDFYKYNGLLFNRSNEAIKFCEIFSNVEQLKCSMVNLDDLFILLTRLSKLSYIQTYTSGDMYLEGIRSLLEEQALKWDLVFDRKQYNIHHFQKPVTIWINRNIR